jgi:hypothetical protein
MGKHVDFNEYNTSRVEMLIDLSPDKLKRLNVAPAKTVQPLPPVQEYK